MSTLIALYADRPQVGKTTVADYLVEEKQFHKLSFATPVKQMVTLFLNSLGVTEPPQDKNEIIPIVGMSQRQLWQTLGTGWGQRMVYESCWADIVLNKVKRHIALGENVVVDDLRLMAEYRALRSLNFTVIGIDNSVAQEQTTNVNHPSNTEWVNFVHDYLISNNGTKEELYTEVEKTLGLALRGLGRPDPAENVA